MFPYQERLIEEQEQLQDRIKALESFMETEEHDALIWTERVRLKRQLQIMRDYDHVLTQRIDSFLGDSHGRRVDRYE